MITQCTLPDIERWTQFKQLFWLQFQRCHYRLLKWVYSHIFHKVFSIFFSSQNGSSPGQIAIEQCRIDAGVDKEEWKILGRIKNSHPTVNCIIKCAFKSLHIVSKHFAYLVCPLECICFNRFRLAKLTESQDLMWRSSSQHYEMRRSLEKRSSKGSEIMLIYAQNTKMKTVVITLSKY